MYRIRLNDDWYFKRMNGNGTLEMSHDDFAVYDFLESAERAAELIGENMPGVPMTIEKV